MHHLLCILATLSLASAIPLPQDDPLTDIVASNPLDTTFTTSTNTYSPDSPDSPDSPLLLSENWSGSGVDQSWTGKDRQPSDSTGMNPRPNDTPTQGGIWPATPNRDGSHAPLFNPKAPGRNDGAPPVPIDVTGGAGSGVGLPSIFNGVIDAPQGLQPNGP